MSNEIKRQISKVKNKKKKVPLYCPLPFNFAFLIFPGGDGWKTLWQDLLFGARMLKTKPGFTLAAVIALALGIGANTAIFSVMMTVLVRPLPFKEPESLVYLWNKNQALGVRARAISRRATSSLSGSGATSCAQITSWTISGVHVKGVDLERVEGMPGQHQFLSDPGCRPAAGPRLR